MFFYHGFLFSSLSYRRPAESPTRRRKRRPSPPATRPGPQRTWRWRNSDWQSWNCTIKWHCWLMWHHVQFTAAISHHHHNPETFSFWWSIDSAMFHRPADRFIAFKEHCIHVFGENKSRGMFFFYKMFVIFSLVFILHNLINVHVFTFYVGN